MDFNKIKNKAAKIKAPDIESVGFDKSVSSLNDLISILKKEDAVLKKNFRKLMIIFSVLGIIYFIIFTMTILWPPDSDSGIAQLVIILALVLFILVVAFSRVMIKQISKADYSKPVSAFIEQVESRYRFFDIKRTFYFVPIFILSWFIFYLSINNAIDRYIGEEYINMGKIFSIILFCLTSILGYIIGKREWKKRKEPIWKALKKIKDELRSAE